MLNSHFPELVNSSSTQTSGGSLRNEEFAVGSLDVKALYPSLKTGRSARLVRELFERSAVEIEVRERELKLYLASTMKQKEIDEEGCIGGRIMVAVEVVGGDQGLQRRR